MTISRITRSELMNDFQNTTNNASSFSMKHSLKWGGIVASIVIVAVVAVLGFLLTYSGEAPAGFLAKWKNAVESGNLKSYDELWLKSHKDKMNSGYLHTAQLLKDKTKLEVRITKAIDRTRKDPRDQNYLRIEDIPMLVHTIGEPLIQIRTLTISKSGLIRQRWKLVQDEVVSQEFGTDLSEFETESTDKTTAQSNSPVAPFVLEWKNALETKNKKKYTSLWDKKAQRTKKNNFQLALVHLSQKSDVDLSQATYTHVARSKTRHVVDNISVTIHSDSTYIETQARELTIEKKGFFFRKWKLINDEIKDNYTTDPSIAQQDQPDVDTITEETSTGIYDGDAPMDTQLKVSQILGKWQKAWEDKDLNTYMSIYADRALITRVTVRNGRETPTYLTKKQLRQKMKQLNIYYGNIQVKVSDLEINGDRAVADVSFLQEFKGTPASGSRPAYRDIGTKTLNLMIDPSDGYWKIYAESWKRYEDVPKYERK